MGSRNSHSTSILFANMRPVIFDKIRSLSADAREHKRKIVFNSLSSQVNRIQTEVPTYSSVKEIICSTQIQRITKQSARRTVDLVKSFSDPSIWIPSLYSSQSVLCLRMMWFMGTGHPSLERCLKNGNTPQNEWSCTLSGTAAVRQKKKWVFNILG